MIWLFRRRGFVRTHTSTPADERGQGLDRRPIEPLCCAGQSPESRELTERLPATYVAATSWLVAAVTVM
jgi:hypothetical protein